MSQSSRDGSKFEHGQRVAIYYADGRFLGTVDRVSGPKPPRIRGDALLILGDDNNYRWVLDLSPAPTHERGNGAAILAGRSDVS